MRDLFPTTHATWLVTHIDSDPAVARDHVMARYFEPLCAYTRASSLRSFGEPADLVNDFFAARLCDASYLSRWSASGLSLRRWLANGLLLHTRNTRLAARRRAEHGTSAPNDELERAAALRASDHETDALLALERAWAVRTVTQAHERIRTELDAESRSAWWELFRLHTIHGMSYAHACPILGISLSSASSIHRTVVDRLRDALRDNLERDGVRADEIDRELALMQDLLS
ncbi:MAG: sigma-70 family RNA polymerase sigma factor [Planctomycetota bacterium]|jgi:DNA-directed RNA polymerase specialized sigma24 family protein|nr:MAG: sigma-70 family RNA polymerase sigma factor [Planctomycetota bacterium]